MKQFRSCDRELSDGAGHNDYFSLRIWISLYKWHDRKNFWLVPILISIRLDSTLLQRLYDSIEQLCLLYIVNHSLTMSK